MALCVVSQTAGEAQPSVIGDMLQNLPERGNRAEQEKIIKEVGAIAYLGAPTH